MLWHSEVVAMQLHHGICEGQGGACAGTVLWHSEVGAMQLHHGIGEGQAVAAQRVGLDDEAGALHGGEHAAEDEVVKLGCAACLLPAGQGSTTVGGGQSAAADE